MEKAQYVHRLGRTARAGKSGKGLIILGDYEAGFLRSLSDLPITEALRPAPPVLAEAQSAIQAGLAATDYATKAQVRAAHSLLASACGAANIPCLVIHYDLMFVSCADKIHALMGVCVCGGGNRRTGPGWASTRVSANCASGTPPAWYKPPTNTLQSLGAERRHRLKRGRSVRWG